LKARKTNKGSRNRQTAVGRAASARSSAERAIKWVFYAGLALGVSVFAPEYFYDGFEVPKLFCVQVAVALIAVLFFFSSVRKKKLSFRLPSAMIPLLALFLIAAFSITWSLNRLLAAERLYHVGALAAWLVFAWALYRGRSIRGPLYFVIFAGAAVAVWALILDWVIPLRNWVYPHFVEVWPGGSKIVDHYRMLTSNQGNPNYLLHILVLTAPSALGALLAELAAFRTEKISRARILVIVCLVFAFLAELICFFTSQNRSGVMAFLFALVLTACLILFYKRAGLKKILLRYWKRLLILIPGLVIAAALFVLYTDTGSALAGRVLKSSSARLEIWKNRFAHLENLENIDVYSRVVFLETGAAMISDDPVLGKGIGQFVIHYPGYKTEKHWEAFKLLQPEIKMWELIPRQSHNEYLQLLIELGLVGFAAFVSFWLIFFARMWKCIKSRSGQPAFYLILGAASGVAGCLANALLTFPLQTVTSGILFWATCGLLLAACCSGREKDDCRKLEVKINLSRPLTRAGLVILALVLPAVCLWASARVIRAQHVFFDSMKQHARDLPYSVKQSQLAAELLPGHFEMQYVAGWIAQINHDRDAATKYYERSVRAAPYFPQPYRYLAEFYYIKGDYEKAEKTLQRYQEVYAPGVPEGSHLVWGLICLRDTTRDRFAEADSHLRKAGRGLEPMIVLAGAYYQRGLPDSTLAILDYWDRRVRTNNKDFPRVAHLYGLASLAAGDTATARDRFGKIIRYAGENQKQFAESARRILEGLDGSKK